MLNMPLVRSSLKLTNYPKLLKVKQTLKRYRYFLQGFHLKYIILEFSDKSYLEHFKHGRLIDNVHPSSQTLGWIILIYTFRDSLFILVHSTLCNLLTNLM